MKPSDTHDADQNTALERALRVSLQAYYGSPPDADALWSKVASSLPSHEAPRRKSIFRRVAFGAHIRRRRSLFPRIALAAFLLLAMGAATYSAVELLRPLLHAPMAEGHHYSQIGATKTTGDITVVIEQAVADHEVIIIGVSGYRPCAIPLPACQFYFDAPPLTINGAQVTPRAIESDGAYRPGKQEEAYVLYYNPPKLAGKPAILSLHLEIRVMSDTNPNGKVLSFDFSLPNGIASGS
jgi:hypothetical protein